MEEYSVAEYAVAARIEIEKAISNGKLPIIVGGTGLYFEALFYPMSFGRASKNPELREMLVKEYDERGGEYMHSKLAQIDAESAGKLHPNDKKRIVRALEIALSNDINKSDSRDLKETPDVICVGFNTERSVLYGRINNRVDEMFAEGLIDEVYQCTKKDKNAFERQAIQAIGYKEFKNASFITFDEKTSIAEPQLTEIKELIKKNTRNYAKRQLTWFRRYDFVQWFECGDYDIATEYVKEQLINKNIR